MATTTQQGSEWEEKDDDDDNDDEEDEYTSEEEEEEEKEASSDDDAGDEETENAFTKAIREAIPDRQEQEKEIAGWKRLYQLCLGQDQLRAAIFSKDLIGIKHALVLLSGTNLCHTTRRTTTTSRRRSCGPSNTTATAIAAANDEDDTKTNNEQNEDITLYCRQINLCSLFDEGEKGSTLLSECIGPDQIHTDIFRMLLIPFEVEQAQGLRQDQEVDGTSNTKLSATRMITKKKARTAVTTVTIATNIVQIINTFCSYGTSNDTLRRSTRSFTPLIMACHYQNYGLVRLLLEMGHADPNRCGNDGVTPLIRMAKIGDLPMVQLLLFCGEDNDDNEDNHHTSSTRNNRWGTDIYKYDQQSMNALIHACTENHEPVVRYLLDYSRRPHRRSTSSSSSSIDYVNDFKVDPPIWYASAHGNTGIVQVLIEEYNAKIHYRLLPTIYSSTPLMEACEWGHLDAVQVLLQYDDDLTSSTLAVSDNDTITTTTTASATATVQIAKELARSAGYTAVVRCIDTWIIKVQNITNFINTGTSGNNNSSSSSNSGRSNNTDNDTNTNVSDSDQKEIEKDHNRDNDDDDDDDNLTIIQGVLPIVISMTAKRYDLTYQIISRYSDSIRSSR